LIDGSPIEGRRRLPPEDLTAAIVLGAAMALGLALSLAVALSWSWTVAIGAAGLAAAGLVYLWRPGLAIIAVLLPFAIVDEGTDDALPGLSRLDSLLYGDYARGFLAPRDVLLVLAAVAAALFFRPAPDRRRRALGPVAWLFVVAGACLVGGLVVGVYLLHDPQGSLVGLRPWYTCVLAAFVVWRVLRSMPRARAEKVVLGASLVVGIALIVIGAARVFGVAGTPVRIDGIAITFFDSASPYALLCCVGVWAAALVERRGSVALRLALGALVLEGLVVAVASQRRSILVGYGIAALALLVLNAFRRRGGLVRSLRLLVGVVAALAVVVLLIGIAVPGASDVFAERASTAVSAAQESSSSDPSLQYRVDESDAVYALAGRNLWTGIGPTAGFTPVNAVSLPTDGSYTHNTYFTLPLRYGLWGILCLAVLVVGLVLLIIRGLLRDPPAQAWVMAAALLALLPAIATAAFFTQTSRWPVVIGAIVGAFDALTDPPEPAAPEDAPR
jgi:O-Antigen ligase